MSGKPLVEISKIVEFFLTLILFISVFWFAFLYTKLKVIFSFAGGVMGNVLSFIFPSLFYLGVTDKKFSKYGIIAFIFIIFGFTTMGICIVSIIQTI
jgi:amino acid permease